MKPLPLTTSIAALFTLAWVSHAVLPTELHGQSVPRRSSLDAAMDPDAIGLEGLIEKKIHLAVTNPTPIFYQSDAQRVLGQMRAGTSVELIAITDTMYRVRGQATHGGVSGWMPRNTLKSSDPELHDKLRQLYDRQIKVEALIKEKIVAIGMTAEEVTACLGKPDRKRSRTTLATQDQTLEYVVYENVPQQTYARDTYGRMVPVVVYVKMETGRVSVTLKDGYVSEIEEVKGNPLAGRIRRNFLPPPIFFR